MLEKSGRGADAGFLTVEITNKMVEYKEIMRRANKSFKPLPTYIYDDLKRMFAT